MTEGVARRLQPNDIRGVMGTRIHG